MDEANMTSSLMNNCTTTPESMREGLQDFWYSYIPFHGYIALAICVCGIVGNLANIIVLSRPKMSSPVNYLLMVIAVAEMLLMITYIPHATVFYIFRQDGRHPAVMSTKSTAILIYFCISFEVLCHSVAIWHTIAVAAFRWLTLGIPNGKVYSTMKNAYICSAVLIIVNCLLSIPNWYTNEMVPGKSTDCLGSNEVLWTIGNRRDVNFNNWIYACFGKILPCALLTILTILLLCIMREAKIRREHLLSSGNHNESKRQKEHNRTTGMLLTVVVIFLTIELPHGVFIILMKSSNKLVYIYAYIGELIEILTLIAFSINFVLYTVMSRQFRSTFFSLFCKKPVEHQANNIRRLSTMVTSVRMTITPRKSVAVNQNSNGSVNHQRLDELLTDHLSPGTPLMAEHSLNTSKSDCSTEPPTTV